VAPTHIDLHVYDATGRQHLVQAFLADSGDWSVRAAINGHVFARECGSWQSVERSLFWFRLHADQTQPPVPRAAAPLAATLGALMILGAAVAASAQPQIPDSHAIRQFTTATQEYAWLHRRLENQLAPLEVNSNPDTINRAVQEMADAVRAARPHARQGDLFTDTLGAELRLRIAGALAANDFTPGDVLTAEAAEAIDAALAPLKVNGPFPWIYASAMFPCVQNALPPLPPELQYRMVGSTLVLIDVHAGLIVDLLPHALAATEL
jgi:hypothetical protein